MILSFLRDLRLALNWWRWFLGAPITGAMIARDHLDYESRRILIDRHDRQEPDRPLRFSFGAPLRNS